MDDEPTIDAKLEILHKMETTWVNTRYQAQIHYKVMKDLGTEKPMLERHFNEIVRCEKALERVRAEIEALVKGGANGRANGAEPHDPTAAHE